jgi:integrase
MMGKRGNGEGGITRHKKSGLHMARYTVETSTGKKRKTVYGKTREEAHEKLVDALAHRHKGLVFEGDDQTLGIYLAGWLRDIEGTIKQRTLENYAYVVNTHITPGLGKIKLKNLKPEKVRALIRDKRDSGLSSRTVQLIHTVLGKALKDAVRDEILHRNVAAAVKPPKQTKREMHPLSPDQARLFLDAARKDRHHALYVVAITTGLREGELLGLRWEDVDLDAGKLAVRKQLTRTSDGLSFTAPKRGKTRSVRLTGHAVNTLKNHRKRQLKERLSAGSLWRENGLVFASTVGTPVDVSNLTYRSFRPLLERAGLPRIRFHDLRHTCATILLGKGTHPKIVQEMLGHATITQTMDTYSHVLPDMQDSAVIAMQEAFL